MDVFGFFELLGGVGLFLYGMNMMSSGLRNAAGEKLRVILEKATSNRVTAILVGILVTLLIQSSSATDMMVISFVNSGLMTLSQAIGVIMGANIGTTVTAQITAFHISAYAPFVLFIGAGMFLFVKKNTVKNIGSVIMGFGMLFFGIAIIQEAIAPLSQSAGFVSFMANLENPAIAITIGILFTALLQSSSSSVVIFQAFAVQGLIGYEMTVYLVIGAAVGAVAPNMLASLTTNRNGKRTAVLNLLFNVFRAVIMVLLVSLIPQFTGFIRNLTPDDIGRQVANTHTIFAVLAVLIELPFANLIVKLSEKIIPLRDSETKQLEDRKLHFMVNTGSVLPSVAIQQVRMELSRMGDIARDGLRKALDCFFDKDDELVQYVSDNEETVDFLTDVIQEKIIELRSKDYSDKISAQLTKMMLVSSDIERISDHAENIIEYEEKLKANKGTISEEGLKDLRTLAEASMDSLDMALRIFKDQEYGLIPEQELLEQRVDDIHDRIINAHIDRLMKDSCDPTGGVVFADIATDLERCSDHANNIAGAVDE